MAGEPEADRFVDLIAQAGVAVTAAHVRLEASIAHNAVQAFARCGKGGGHPAQLDFGDCLSYACAAEHGAPILFKGSDIVHTDLASVIS